MRPLVLPLEPYLGVSCPGPNRIGCDTVGLAVWLAKPCRRLTAMVAGRSVSMAARRGYAGGPRGTYFEGFLHPAGLTSKGPLHVQPDGPGGYWEGRHPVRAVVRLTAHYGDGAAASRTVWLWLHAGWG
jgi:hypothetical protein